MIHSNSTFRDFEIEHGSLCSHKIHFIFFSEIRVIRQLKNEHQLILGCAQGFVYVNVRSGTTLDISSAPHSLHASMLHWLDS